MESRISVSSEESFWNDQKDHLRKIRDVLAHSARQRHSPVSNGYRKPRPAFLPNSVRKPESPTLRGSKYNVIPPLKLQSSHRRNDGYDSWGDDDRDSEIEDREFLRPFLLSRHPVKSRPQTAQLPKPQKGVLLLNHNRSTDKPVKRVTYDTEPTIAKSSKGDPFDPVSNPLLAKYLPMSVSSTRGNPAFKSQDQFSFLDQDPLFANRFVNRLIEEFLEEEIIPDLLIEFYREEESRKSPQLRYIYNYEPEKFEPRKIQKHKIDGDVDHLKKFLNALVDEVIDEECKLIARAAGRELADALMERLAIYDIIMDMATEEILQTGDFIVDEALLEVTIEDLVDEMLVYPEVAKQSEDVALKTLHQFNNKIRLTEIQQIDKSVGQRIQEELCFDYLMKLAARQGQLWTKEEYTDKILDDMMLSFLVGHSYDVKRRRKATIDSVPLRRFHEKAITDIALECLVNELSKHLDEDMADLDLYEQGTMQNIHKWLASNGPLPLR